MQLHLLQTAVALLLILHVEYLYQLQRNYLPVGDCLGLEDVGELALANELYDFEAVDDHAHMMHNVVLSVGH
jgi:hypothetical protein